MAYIGSQEILAEEEAYLKRFSCDGVSDRGVERAARRETRKTGGVGAVTARDGLRNVRGRSKLKESEPGRPL